MNDKEVFQDSTRISSFSEAPLGQKNWKLGVKKTLYRTLVSAVYAFSKYNIPNNVAHNYMPNLVEAPHQLKASLNYCNIIWFYRLG